MLMCTSYLIYVMSRLDLENLVLRILCQYKHAQFSIFTFFAVTFMDVHLWLFMISID